MDEQETNRWIQVSKDLLLYNIQVVLLFLFLRNTRKYSQHLYLLRYSFFKREKNKIKRDNFISIMVGHPAMAILFKIYIQNSDVVLSNKALKKDMVGKKYKNLFKRFE